MRRSWRAWILSALLVLGLCLAASSCGQHQPEKDSVARYIEAKDRYAAGDLAGAEQLLTAVLARDRRFHQAAFLLGKVRYFQDGTADARRIFTALVRGHRGYNEAEIWLARVMMQQGAIGEATRTVDRLLSFDSGDPRLLLLRGSLALEESDLEAALGFFKAAAGFADELARAHLEIARLYYQFGLRGQALEELEACRSLASPGQPRGRGCRHAGRDGPQGGTLTMTGQGWRVNGSGAAARGKACLLMGVMLVLASCVMLPRSRTQVFLADPPPRAGRWAVGSVIVDHRTASELIRTMLEDCLLPISRANGLPLVEGAEGDFLLDIRLTEREIARDLDMVTVMSATLTIRQGSEERLAATVLYSEESRESLASLYHLQSVIDALMKSLAKELKARAAGDQAAAG